MQRLVFVINGSRGHNFGKHRFDLLRGETDLAHRLVAESLSRLVRLVVKAVQLGNLVESVLDVTELGLQAVVGVISRDVTCGCDFSRATI